MDTKELRAAIKKQLPAEVGDVLQERLKLADKAEKLERDLSVEEQKTRRQDVQVSRLTERLKEANESIGKLNTRIERLEEEQRNATVTLTQVKLAEAEKRSNLAERIVMAVVDGRKTVRTKVTDTPTVVKGYDGQEQVVSTETKTTETEEKAD